MSRVYASEAEVLALSPDASSSKAAKGLLGLSKWPLLGGNDSAVWGECQGSGSKPYQTQVDLGAPAFKCSCPSRKFPCKHGLALMLLRADNKVSEGAAPPEWVQSWLDSRQEKAEKKEARAAEAAAAPPPSPEALAKREDKRWDKTLAGLQELSLWMQDMVRTGLAALSSDAQASDRWRTMAARMVDAQAPGMGARIKATWELVDSHPKWQTDVLVQLAQWQLICDAALRRDALGDGIKADVMAALGWPVDKASVQAQGDAVDDEWLVLGLRHIEREGNLHERRVWLQGLRSGRMALLLDHVHGTRGHEQAWLAGSRYACTLNFYPSHAALRAMAAAGNGGAMAEAGAPLLLAQVADGLQAMAARQAAAPLQQTQALWGAQITLLPPAPDSAGWQGAWPRGEQAVPVALDLNEAQAWQLLAITGGVPLQLFGEWEGARWHVLSAWLADEQQALSLVWQREEHA